MNKPFTLFSELSSAWSSPGFGETRHLSGDTGYLAHLGAPERADA